MKASSLEKALLFRFPRERRIAHVIGLIVALWIVTAYAVLPVIWRHYEGAPALAGQPMVTRTTAGIPGDPINIAFVGSETDVVCAFHAAGWHSANAVTLASSIRIVGSVVLDRPDPAAPVSPLIYEGRPEDLAFEKPDGGSADRRHHIRLWRINAADDSHRHVWVGAATFDRGVGVSRYTLQVTHHIAADIDAERDFVVADLSNVGMITQTLEAAGIGPTFNGRNGGGDRYFTDGEIIVAALSGACSAQPPATPAVVPPPTVVRWKDTLWRALKSWM